MEEVEIDQEHVEQLKTSKLKFGAIAPIILDKNGNIVDGFHRFEADPRWSKVTYDEIKTEEDRMLYAIASNWHRKEKSKKWKTWMLAWLAKQGHNPEEIAKRARLKLRTVYKYLPDEFKERPGIGGPKPKPVARRATQEKPEPEVEAKIIEAPSFELPEVKIRDFERWEDREARMHPRVSKMDEAVYHKLQREGWDVESQVEFCVLSTTPDLKVNATPDGRKVNAVVYLDGKEAHKGREEQDVELRTLLAKRHRVRVVPIPYKRYSESAVEEVTAQIKEALSK